MPFSVVSLLLVLIQLFHFGGAKITPDNHRTTSLIVSRQHRVFRRTPTASFSWFESVEDSEKQKADALTAKVAFVVTGQSATYKPFLPLLNRIFRAFRARSNLDEQRLFLDYCNFRV